MQKSLPMWQQLSIVTGLGVLVIGGGAWWWVARERDRSGFRSIERVESEAPAREDAEPEFDPEQMRDIAARVVEEMRDREEQENMARLGAIAGAMQRYDGCMILRMGDDDSASPWLVCPGGPGEVWTVFGKLRDRAGQVRWLEITLQCVADGGFSLDEIGEL